MFRLAVSSNIAAAMLVITKICTSTVVVF